MKELRLGLFFGLLLVIPPFAFKNTAAIETSATFHSVVPDPGTEEKEPLIPECRDSLSLWLTWLQNYSK